MSSEDRASTNVLIIITDQHRADHLGFMGNQVLNTPHLDALASQGVVFENAWVTNPVCMPNRSTIMTGRMPTAHGVVFNDRSLDWGANTFVRRFTDEGYRTVLVGKSHLQHGMSKNSVVPFRGGGATRVPYPDGWDQLEDFERYLEGNADPVEDFYGFQQAEFAIDHGARVSGHHLRWALEKGGRYEDLVVDYDGTSPGRYRSEHWWQIYQPPYGEELHSTRFVTERTIAHIEDAARHKGDQPWLIWCSYPDPHHPMTPPGQWFDRYRPEDMVLPATRHDDLARAPAHLRVFRDIHPREQREWVSPCGYGDDALLAQAIAATYGMVEMIDDGIGEILRALERLQLEDDTIVVFTSDHGDMMGDHGLFLKGFMHYRGTLQVPLVIKVPGVTSRRTAKLASSIDIGPTLMDMCRIAPYDGVQGRSLQPLLADDGPVREYILIEDDIAEITAKLTPIPAKTRTLVTEQHRYTRNSKGEQQLFDLTQDPTRWKISRTVTRLRA